MKMLLVVLLSSFGGALIGEHYHSFLLGACVALLAVGSCYWFSFRSTKSPQFALFLLFCGMFSKLLITTLGVAFGLSADVISSPTIFILTYFAFAICATHAWYKHEQEKLTAKQS